MLKSKRIDPKSWLFNDIMQAYMCNCQCHHIKFAILILVYVDTNIQRKQTDNCKCTKQWNRDYYVHQFCIIVWYMHQKQITILSMDICRCIVFVLCDIIWIQREASIMVVIMMLEESGLGHIDIPVCMIWEILSCGCFRFLYSMCLY